MTRSGVFLVVTCLTFSAIAQDRLSESIEVRVVNIDAVVTDRDGRPVTGLTAADFEILEDGRPQQAGAFCRSASSIRSAANRRCADERGGEVAA